MSESALHVGINSKKKHILKFVCVFIYLLSLFCLYSFLAIGSNHKFASPDETANYFFASHFAQTFSLHVPQPIASDFLSPRSIQVINGFFVPVSFLGLPLFYGSLLYVFGFHVTEFLTPLFSVFAVCSFFSIIYNISLNKKTAYLSAILLSIHPAFIYYSNRGLFHNILFVDLLIISIFFFLKSTEFNREKVYTKSLYYILSGLTFGSSIAVRTSEIIWVLPLFFFFLFLRRKKINTRLFLIAFPIALVLIFYIIFTQNFELYKNPFSSGYTLIADSISSSTISPNQNLSTAIQSLISKSLFPFGINIALAAQIGWKFLVSVVWPYAILSLFGFITLVKILTKWFFSHSNSSFVRRSLRFSKNPLFAYMFLALIISIYILIYYGSWYIQDNPIPTSQIGIEQSYARYFLPIYILWIPFAAFFIERFHKFIVFGVFLVLIINSLEVSFLSNINGLVKLKFNTLQYTSIQHTARNVLPQDTIILTNSSDKILFPEFQVAQISPFNIPINQINEIKRLLHEERHICVYIDHENPSDVQFPKTLAQYDITLSSIHSLSNSSDCTDLRQEK